jgi:hypothetical protein
LTLAAGSKLGPYEILGQIGAGGMGEIWKAKDPRLGRDVAIKVLPASFRSLCFRASGVISDSRFGSETTIGAGRRDVYNAHVYTH